MSFQAMAWAVKQKTGDASGRALLLTLANYADEHGKCWPSLSRLAEDCEMHRATVIRKLETLRDLGLITREQKQTPAGTYNVYHLSLEATPSRTERLPQSHRATPLVAQSDPIQSDEPIKEPITKGGRKRPIPDGWVPSDEDISKAQAECPHINASHEAKRFVEDAHANQRKHVLWPRAYHNWCLKAEGWAVERAQRTGSRSANAERAARMLKLING